MVIGWRTKLVNLPKAEFYRCHNCAQDQSFHIVLQYTYWHLYWLFGVVTRKRYMMLCDICRRGWDLEANKVEPFLDEPIIPFMNRYGLAALFLASLVVGLVLMPVLGR